jgi:hypothetical protein
MSNNTNTVNVYNLNSFLAVYFKLYVESKRISGTQKLKQKFSNLKQKVGEKIRRENLQESEHVFEVKQEKKDDYFDKLRNFYTLKKDKVNHNLKNFREFYQKRLDEKESTKVLKNMTKWSLLFSYSVLNFIYMKKVGKARFWFFLASTSGFLCLNIFLQYKLNARYKRRIRNLVLNESEN